MDSALVKWLLKRKRENDPNLNQKDIVILHQFDRGAFAPSVSAFALKLETWIRMAGIDYKNDFTFEKSPKGKIPWITYNGEHISDSHFCIEYLIEKFGIDLSKHLSAAEKSIARAYLKLNEESLRWVGVIARFKYGKPEDIAMNSFIFKTVGSKMVNEAVSQGYGRHTEEELFQIGMDDMQAINTFIADKKFLMGDKPCNEDSSMFGIMCQAMFNDRGRLNQYLKSDCPNILRYIETMKTTYWPDWNDCLQKNKS